MVDRLAALILLRSRTKEILLDLLRALETLEKDIYIQIRLWLLQWVLATGPGLAPIQCNMFGLLGF
jgi:hypothetical protein